MDDLKYVPIYRSLYECLKELDKRGRLSDKRFRKCIMSLLQYGFDGSELDDDDDDIVMSIYIQNIPFIEKAALNITNGKKGGRPKTKKTPVKPDKEKESETATEKETENDTVSSVSPPQKGGSTTDDRWQHLDEEIRKINDEKNVSEWTDC